MNNKVLMAAIAVAVTALILVLIFAGLSSCDAEKDPNYVEPGYEAELGENETENSESTESDDNGFNNTEDWVEPVIGEDDGFEGSDIPPSNSTSSENKDNSSSSSSESEESSRPSSGDTSSRPSSGGSSSGSSSSGSSSDSSEEDDGEITYEDYLNMSGEEQKEYMESFESVDAFFEWYNAAKAKYEEENAGTEIEGEVDLGDYVNP